MIPGSETLLFTGPTKEITRIAQADCKGNPWYVSRYFDTDNWRDTRYLHGDGTWREETQVNGIFGGLYINRDEALSAIARYESLEEAKNTPPKKRVPKTPSPPPVIPEPEPESSPVISNPKILESNLNWRALDKLQEMVDKAEKKKKKNK